LQHPAIDAREIPARPHGSWFGSWEDIEQEVRYAWYLPTIHYVFRAYYDRPHRIELRLLSGDLKKEEGTWLLKPSPDASATVVEYEMYVDRDSGSRRRSSRAPSGRTCRRHSAG